ncbi:MAG TPA: tartrate-resistant acid phosphatase type 5 family protein [Rubricoccaceae bacterium]|nr:tartrate-resistant acid phosphatase type 5 family protein [Rubricoccaceae bacterium]
MSRLLLVLALLPTLAAGCFAPNVPGLGPDETPDPFSREAFNFIVIGDWGRDGRFGQRAVAEAMAVTADSIAARFFVSTGDNFYPSGVRSADDDKFETSFERIYTASALQERWFMTLGNHDWQGRVGPQIEYTERSRRWYLPANYYASEMDMDDSTRVLLVFLDTTPLVDGEIRGRYDPNGHWNPEAQYRWLDSTLARSEAQWKLVFGHHPVYVGSSRYRDSPELIERLVPILERHRVQAYICGHDHNLQHLKRDGSPVHYFLSGGGSLTRGIRQTPNTLFAVRTSGYMAFSLTASQMYVQFFGPRRQVYYFANVPVSEDDGVAPPVATGDRPPISPPPSNNDEVQEAGEAIQDAEDAADSTTNGRGGGR